MNRRAVWAAFAAATCWATTGIFVRQLDSMPLGVQLWLRFAVSLALMLPLTFRQPEPHAEPPPPSQIKSLKDPVTSGHRWLADAGPASFMSMYYIFATIGFALGPVALTSLIIALTPAVTLAWQLAASHSVATRELLGFSVAVIGVGCYLFPLLSQTTQFTNTSILLAGLAAAAATLVRAVYTILVWNRARAGIAVHARRMNQITFSLAAVALTPLFLTQAGAVSWSWNQLIPLAALVLIATVAPNVLNTWASARLAPTTNAIIGMITPPVTGLLGWFLLGEALNILQWCGLALTLVGVAVSTLKFGPTPIPIARC